MFGFFLFCVLLLSSYATAEEKSLCPSVFKMISSAKGRWDGELTLQADDDLYGIWVRVLFDKAFDKMELLDKTAEVDTSDHQSYLLKNRNFTLIADEPLKIKFAVFYKSTDEPPKLTGVRLNARYICPDKSHGIQWVGQDANNFEEKEFLGDLNSQDFLSQRPAANTVQGCGMVPLKNKAIDKNAKSKEGHWPWHVSIYATKNSKESLICSGVLISGGHVLTAAHCVTQRKTRTTISPSLLTIYGGKFNLKGESAGDQKLHVAHILTHPAFNPQTLDNNIAIVRLSRGIVMDDYVRPVCLWEESPDVEAIIRRQGHVAGFAFNEKHQYSKQLTDAKMAVTPSLTCAKSNANLAEFLSDKVFCAGNEKGNSLCVGDSGSGMVFPRQGSPNIWQLRGIVSVSLALQKQFVCDDSHFAVFTDVAKYLDWIRKSIA